VSNEEAVKPCRGIAMQFKKHTFQIPYFYLLFKQKIENFDKKNW